ncbi:MAG: 1,4-alpha-glucan branching enzyme, partial [Candidatus Obscuribacterales bacterium]|nr:1,4-alpha-glucan branching enzyme [Steroidobacteraceae bacterium]
MSANSEPLTGYDLHLFAEGNHHHMYRKLGAHVGVHAGATGTRFAVWAPNATGVSVVGSFNGWNSQQHPMQVHHGFGVWELFIPDVVAGALYKYLIRTRDGHVSLKTDPFAEQMQLRPETASIVAAPDAVEWHDQAWLEHRR